MRNMSHSLTTQAAIDMLKTVTRREGWWNLKPGECVQQVVKGMGLAKGEKVQKIHVVKVISATSERLFRLLDDEAYGKAEVIAEGFPHYTPLEFVKMFCESRHSVTPQTMVNRIEYRYLLNKNDIIRVPVEISKCVSCGAPLYLSGDGWTLGDHSEWICDSFNMICGSEPKTDDDREAWDIYNDIHALHFKMPYIYWLPIQEKIRAWMDRSIIFQGDFS